jgi:hypothetical protein
LLIAPVALVAVVGVALVSGPVREPAPVVEPVAPASTLEAPLVTAHRRETGTDGPMGRLSFDLPPDDAGTDGSHDTTPPWVRRLEALSLPAVRRYQR